MHLGMTEADYRRLTGRLYEATWKPQTSKFKNPAGWQKPESYPGLIGSEHTIALAKGFLNLGLVDPSTVKKGDSKLKKTVLKSLAKLLHKTNGKKAFVRDPEGVLKAIYKGQFVKKGLSADLSEVLSALYDKQVGVKLKMGVGKTAVGWSLASSSLKESSGLEGAMLTLVRLGRGRTADTAEADDAQASEICTSYGPNVVRSMDRLYRMQFEERPERSGAVAVSLSHLPSRKKKRRK